MNDVRKLTEGAIIAALYLVLLFITMFVPFIGMVSIWFLPLLYIIYVMRQGLKASIVLWAVTMIGTFFIGGIILLPLTLMFGSGGIIVGELFRRKKSAFAILLGGSLTYIANILLNFIFSIVVFDINLFEDTQKVMRESLDTASSMISSLGQDGSEQLALYYDFIDTLPHMAPFILVAFGIVFALLTQLASSYTLKKMNYAVPMLPPFRKWSFPKSFLWYYLIVLIIMLIGVEKGTALYTVTINLFPMFEIIMAIQGAAFLFHYFYEKKLSIAFPIIIVVFMMLLPPLMTVVRLVGIIDLGFDLRSRIQSR